jgi:hypothetical protein
MYFRLSLYSQAYKVGLYGPKIVWIFTGPFPQHWWRLELDDLDCTADQMDKVQ